MSEASAEAHDIVAKSPVPALLVQIVGATILAASDEAGRLIGRPSRSLIGKSLEDFYADEPSGGMPLVQDGRLTGFEAKRVIRFEDGTEERVQVWIRAAEQTTPVELVIAVLWPNREPSSGYLSEPGAAPRTVFGTLDAELTIDRISEDVAILGFAADEMVGAPLLRLVEVQSVADALLLLAEAARKSRGVCLHIRVRTATGYLIAILALRRLVPSTSFAFALVFDGTDQTVEPQGAETVLRSFDAGLRALDASIAAGVIDALPHGAERLSPRESEIVARLLSGDRVPAIAQALFLSQSTVRNHLSTAFSKLRVGSQQELIDLYRNRVDGVLEHDQ